MLKIGIVGGGRIGKVHCKSISYYVPGAEVKTIADPLKNKELEQFADELGVKHVTKDYRDIINDPEIDIVLVCSSTDTHAQISIEAARAGKHVFCEKPVDHDADKIREVIKVVEESGVKFQVGFNRRFDSNFKAVKDAIMEGKIGSPQIIRITSRDPEAPPVSYVKVSGGMFLDMTIHDFDMVRFLSGSEADEVYAAGAVLIDPAIGEAGDVDTAVITIKMKDGTLATIDNSRKAVYGYDQRAEVFGSKGSVSISNNTSSTTVISDENGVHQEKPLYFFLERYMESFSSEMRAFIEAVKNDTDTPVGAADGLAPVLIGMAAKKSMQENRPVKLSEIEL
jgi:myo-inositol 2-dehydrogenase/D-chiro-inositol 1-dehydrogenase